MSSMTKLFPDEVIGREETCERLGISRTTLHAMMDRGEIVPWKRSSDRQNGTLLFNLYDVLALKHNRRDTWSRNKKS